MRIWDPGWKNFGYGFRDPGSGMEKSRIQDPGSGKTSPIRNTGFFYKFMTVLLVLPSQHFQNICSSEQLNFLLIVWTL
jgi:hypothetical protein